MQANPGGTSDLNKTKIGDYLGENDVFNKNVLATFAQLQDFKGMSFDKALRCVARHGVIFHIHSVMTQPAGRTYGASAFPARRKRLTG